MVRQLAADEVLVPVYRFTKNRGWVRLHNEIIKKRDLAKRKSYPSQPKKSGT